MAQPTGTMWYSIQSLCRAVVTETTASFWSMPDRTAHSASRKYNKDLGIVASKMTEGGPNEFNISHTLWPRIGDTVRSHFIPGKQGTATTRRRSSCSAMCVLVIITRFILRLFIYFVFLKYSNFKENAWVFKKASGNWRWWWWW